MTKIEHRDNIWFLTIPGREAPMGFFSRESAVSFVTNNLHMPIKWVNAPIKWEDSSILWVDKTPVAVGGVNV